MNILYKYTIPEALMISGHTIEARRRPPRNCFTARRLHYQWRCLYHVCTTCTQPVVNTTDKTAAVPYAAVAVPVGTTPVISAMITTVIVPVVTAAVIAIRNVGTTIPTVIVVAKHWCPMRNSFDCPAEQECGGVEHYYRPCEDDSVLV